MYSSARKYTDQGVCTSVLAKIWVQRVYARTYVVWTKMFVSIA